MPNAFAYVMLISWPLVAAVLFRVFPLQKALVWTLMGGYLILPAATQFKVPMLPAFDKSLIPTLSALVLCRIYAPRLALASDWTGRTGRMLIMALGALLVVGPFITVLQNPEPIIAGPRFIPGLRIYDALSMISSIFAAILPFWLGLRYLNDRKGHQILLQAFVIGALIYSLPVIFEARMSPQLHTWIYGFFQHDFIQHIRAGGFRPIVFLSHGLMVGILFCMSLISALVLWREAIRERRTASGWLFAAIWLMIVLVISKNLGALALASLFSALIVFTGRSVQTTVAIVVAGAIIFYPMLRGAGAIPVDAIHDLALSIDEERAFSLKFRFDNEDSLLERANEKPLFGWGNWGRNQIFNPVSGEMTSVTDGIWIILIGVYGWLGYVAHFGLLVLPILFYAIRRRQFGPSLITPGLIVVLCVALIDLIPNAGLVAYVWLIAGGLAGYVLWRPEEPASSANASTPTAEIAGGTVAKPASWVMSPNGPPQRRSRTSRQRGME
jgi:hypothetical protein